MKRTFNELVSEFLANIDMTDASKDTYMRALKVFSKWIVFSGRKIQYLKRADILAYKSDLISSGKKENTIQLYLNVLKSFYEYLEDLREHENIAAGIRIKKKKREFEKAHLSLNEVNTLLNSIDTDTVIGKRDYAMINLMIRTGIRCVEASRLRICDIEETEDDYILHIRRKGSLSRMVKLFAPAKAIEPIHEYLCYACPESEQEYVFKALRSKRQLTSVGLGQLICGRMKAAGVHSPEKTAHSLRHTAAVHALLNGASIKDVQTMLGHSDPKTTEVYLSSVNEEMRLNNRAIQCLDDAF